MKEEAIEYLLDASNMFVEKFSQKGNSMDSNDVKHIMKYLDQDTRIQEMHGLGKLHKGNVFPQPYRLVMAIVGSKFHGIGRWLDNRLKELLPF